jgi:hypothetical protein
MQRRDFFKKLGLVAASSALTPAISFASETKVVSKNTMSTKQLLMLSLEAKQLQYHQR